ncbi:hypothetical protein L9F63_002354, partial [Diploptera punctata]
LCNAALLLILLNEAGRWRWRDRYTIFHVRRKKIRTPCECICIVHFETQWYSRNQLHAKSKPPVPHLTVIPARFFHWNYDLKTVILFGIFFFLQIVACTEDVKNVHILLEYRSFRKLLIRVPASLTTDLCRSAIMQKCFFRIFCSDLQTSLRQ